VHTSIATVILLNGTSSAGKSTLAAALLETLPEPWTVMAIDQFHRGRSRSLSPEAREMIARRTVLGFHRAVAGFASQGNDVIVDHLLGEPWRVDDWLAVMRDVRTYFVGVYCDSAVLAERETARGNRTLGRAASQLGTIHADIIYDLCLDTTCTEPDALARQVALYVQSHAPGAVAAMQRGRATRIQG
jgi:chloramphenicol 3-O phosphotransferase